MKNNIRLFREIRGYSQQYVAKRLRKSQAAYSKMENGHTKLSKDIMEQIGNILEVPKEKLFENEDVLMEPMNSMVSQLLDELSQNKKLLKEVELNQGKLREQLNLLLCKLTEEGNSLNY